MEEQVVEIRLFQSFPISTVHSRHDLYRVTLTCAGATGIESILLPELKNSFPL